MNGIFYSLSESEDIVKINKIIIIPALFLLTAHERQEQYVGEIGTIERAMKKSDVITRSDKERFSERPLSTLA